MLFAPAPLALVSILGLLATAQPVMAAGPGMSSAASPLSTDSGPGEADERERPPEALSRTTGTPLEAPIAPEKYICGQGDLFQLNFWGRQNASVRFQVDASGRAFIPRVGYIAVAGLLLKDATVALRGAVGRFYPGLSFDVSLVEPRTFSVHVVGAVTRPGVYTARATERITKVLAAAGVSGLGGAAAATAKGGPDGKAVRSNEVPGASLRRIELARRDGTKINADLLLYAQRGDLAQNPFLLDGDVITVPFESLAATVSGAVQRPGRYELIATKDVTELVALAGGLRADATRKLPVRVSRRGADDRLVLMPVPYGADGSLPPVELRGEDRVHISASEELQRSVLLVGAIEGSSAADEATGVKRIPFEQGDTVRMLIERAGGVSAGADLQRSYILRRQGKDGQEEVLIPIDLEALLIRRDLTADRPVAIGDIVTVPYQRRSVMVEGAVMRPGVYQFNPRLRFEDYVTNAGGPNKMARDRDTYRLVTPQGHVATIGDKPSVRPGDTIVVPERHFSRAEVTQIIMSSISLAIATAAMVFTVTR